MASNCFVCCLMRLSTFLRKDCWNWYFEHAWGDGSFNGWGCPLNCRSRKKDIIKQSHSHLWVLRRWIASILNYYRQTLLPSTFPCSSHKETVCLASANCKPRKFQNLAPSFEVHRDLVRHLSRFDHERWQRQDCSCLTILGILYLEEYLVQDIITDEVLNVVAW